ncbi:hypothetical protein BKA56DRAFT_669724 [Ilyonectria sp. MPI-CAGE-AT-0026]|nr:hypothetical protein BKA56DRAFT_669724 [Ilyonectria sp. MPI-CAGE-AT-0026]
MGFFSSPLFNPEYKTKAHIGQFVLIAIIIALAICKIATKPSYIPMNRLDMIGISMSGKTIIVIAYQLLTEHVSRFQKWASLKAYAILNTLEVFLWFVVIILTLWGISMVCVGISCAFGWLVALMCLVMTIASFWMAVVSWKEVRNAKDFGKQGPGVIPSHQPYRMPAYSSSSQSMAR